MHSDSDCRPARLLWTLPAVLLLAGALLWLPRGAKGAAAPDLPAADELLSTALPAEELPETAVIESVLPELSMTGTALAAPAPAAPAAAAAAAQPVSVVRDGAGTAAGTVYFRNETDFRLDAAAMLRAACPVSLGDSGVQVLIMHTHGTEAYTPTAAEPYRATDSYRTTDSSHNMLRVGQLIADTLNARGVRTVHSTALNDYPAYSGAYTRALKDIGAWVKKYPTVRIVIDVHRDAMMSGGKVYKTVAAIGGVQTAQLEFVAGTDAGGLSHDRWRQNLTYQVQLQYRLNTRFPGLMRPLNLRRGRFNQHVRTGSMLLEVGTNGNTLEEALAAARLFADTLADQLLGK